MQVPHFMRQVNRLFTNPIVGLFAVSIPPLAIACHLGRKSGRSYRTPIVAFPTEDGFVTPLPYGVDTDWCLNVMAADGCYLETRSTEIPVENPRIVDSETALPLLPGVLRPALQLAELPGYLLLDQAVAEGSTS